MVPPFSACAIRARLFCRIGVWDEQAGLVLLLPSKGKICAGTRATIGREPYASCSGENGRRQKR